MEIIPCNDHLEELIDFVARLNSDGTHHIGFFGEGEADIRASLAECLIPPGDGFRLGYQEQKLAGIFGVDADPEISRAWLFGPIVEHADWHAVADQLYAEVLALIPAEIRDYDLFCDVQNIHLEGFAVRHGFAPSSENAVLTLERDHYRSASKGRTTIVPYQTEFFEQLGHLHTTLFPKAYFTARQMVDRVDLHRQLFLAVQDGRLLGYHFCKIEPESESGYVDFIGTDAAVRGQGIGADLLAVGVDWMLSAPTTKKINLTVNADNVAARSLYEAFGFRVERIMRGYRKQLT